MKATHQSRCAFVVMAVLLCSAVGWAQSALYPTEAYARDNISSWRAEKNFGDYNDAPRAVTQFFRVQYSGSYRGLAYILNSIDQTAPDHYSVYLLEVPGPEAKALSEANLLCAWQHVPRGRPGVVFLEFSQAQPACAKFDIQAEQWYAVQWMYDPDGDRVPDILSDENPSGYGLLCGASEPGIGRCLWYQGTWEDCGMVAWIALADQPPSRPTASPDKVRTQIAQQPRYQWDAAKWELHPRGATNKSGETTVEVQFPVAWQLAPVKFGLPVGALADPANVAVFNEDGKPIPADVFPLGNWRTMSPRWVLICTLLQGSPEQPRTLTVRYGPQVAPAEPARVLTAEKQDNGCVRIKNTTYNLTLDPQRAIRSITIDTDGDGKMDTPEMLPEGMTAAMTPVNGEPLLPQSAVLKTIYDGRLYKLYYLTCSLGQDLTARFEVEIWAGSPLIFLKTRFISHSLQDLDLYSLTPLRTTSLGAGFQLLVGAAGGKPLKANGPLDVCQRVNNWQIRTPVQTLAEGSEDNLGEWISFWNEDIGQCISFIVPNFQEMSPGDPHLESCLQVGKYNSLELEHYRPIEDQPDCIFRSGMARGFPAVLYVSHRPDFAPVVAAKLKAQPHPIYDREYLTAQGTLPEDEVSHAYDTASLEGARYFHRALIPRQYYPIGSRGTTGIGEGTSMEGRNLHAGGMLYGEVWQYMSDGHPGTCSYRCGDIPLALCYEYMRSGDRSVWEIMNLHNQLFADYAIYHAPTLLQGGNHYYCSWYSMTYVYLRLKGMIVSYYLTGDPWYYRAADQMGSCAVCSWRYSMPVDSGFPDRIGGAAQGRAPYVARGLVALYCMTGDPAFYHTAVDLAHYAMRAQTDEGFWWAVLSGPQWQDNQYISALHAGYSMTGLFRLYEQTKNKELLQSLRRACDWLVSIQFGAEELDPGLWARTQAYPGNADKMANISTSELVAGNLTDLYQATGEQQYFYAANAGWANSVGAQRSDGSIPMEVGNSSSTWSFTLCEYAPRFAGIAERDQLPFVIHTYLPNRTDAVYLLGDGRYDGNTYQFSLVVRRSEPTQLPVWCPKAPSEVKLDGAPAQATFNPATGVLTLTVPPKPNREPPTVRVAIQFP